MNRIALDSAEWPEWDCEQRPMPILAEWQQTPPPPDELDQFMDDVGCSHCVYDSFFASLPYMLDGIEKSKDIVRNELIHSMSLRIIQAAEQRDAKSEVLASQLDESLPRIRKIVLELLESDIEISTYQKKAHPAILAACYGEPAMGLQILFVDD